MSPSRARRTRVVLESAARDACELRPAVIIKLGGSLLREPLLIDHIQWLCRQRPRAKILCVCGGGAAADSVRHWQSMHKVSDLAAHRLALAAMHFNARLLHSVLPDSRLVASAGELRQTWTRGHFAIFCTEPFLEEIEAAEGRSLPVGWHVTSDSIALLVAQHLHASELILAKSTELEPGTSLEAARRAGLVDTHFGAEGLPEVVSWVNLRSESADVVPWL